MEQNSLTCKMTDLFEDLLGDISDSEKAKEFERQFLRIQRIDSIGSMAAGIAHDLNNVFSPIMITLSILNRKLTSDVDRKLIGDLKKSINMGVNLVRQVLHVSRGGEGDSTEIQIRHLAEDVKDILKQTFPANINISTDIPKGLNTILGDVTQIQQILFNLLINARDAMPNGGRVTVSAKNVELDQSFVDEDGDLKSGSYILLSVADTGSGIPQDVLKKIFEPFFTTKEIGKGTGLGLATVRSIVKKHGGFIKVATAVGKGTRFDIYLPATTENISKKEISEDIPIALGNNELILVVDDDQVFCESTKIMLESSGYRVMTAHNGLEGFQKFVDYQNEVKIVLTDISMPVCDGSTMIYALRAISEDVDIIAVSGSKKDDVDDKLLQENVDLMVMKPFAGEELIQDIHRILNS
jgi:two-component system, cell cycle sensor histidine kinase and response regulator CckA